MSTLVSTTPAVAVRPVKRYRLRRRLGDALTYLGLAVALVFFLGPFFWILTTSLKGNSDFFAFPPVWIPHDPSLTHYAGALHAGQRPALLPQQPDHLLHEHGRRPAGEPARPPTPSPAGGSGVACSVPSCSSSACCRPSP